ncbi:hypothetical protein AAMO2058_000985200 [Amorphochlora amoebiformis]
MRSSPRGGHISDYRPRGQEGKGIGSERDSRLDVDNALFLRLNSKSMFVYQRKNTVDSTPPDSVCLFKSMNASEGCLNYIQKLQTDPQLEDKIKDALSVGEKSIMGGKLHVKSITAFIHWLGADNYYHFLAETLPYLISEISRKMTSGQPQPAKTPQHYVALPTSKPHFFIQAVFKSIGLDPSLIIDLQNSKPLLLSCNSLSVIPGVSSHSRHSVSATKSVLSTSRKYIRRFFPSWGYGLAGGEREGLLSFRKVLWISRQGALYRRLKGGPNPLISTIRNKSLQLIPKIRVEVELLKSGKEPDALTFKSTLNKISSADVIGGVHGAGLSNMLFAKPSVKILEVLPLVPGMINYHYWTLSSALGLNYTVFPASVLHRDLIQFEAFGKKLYTVKEFEIPVDPLASEFIRILL